MSWFSSSFFLLARFFFFRDNFPTLIETTIRTNGMGQSHFTAIAAYYQIPGLQGIL
jgi:hypothetical protein